MSGVGATTQKLRGSFRYLAEGAPAGTLHGALLTSPLPHARIVRLDASRAEGMPGVRAVVTAADLPDGFLIGPRFRDRPPLARDVVRLHGETIAAVAADTAEVAEEAVRRISFELDPLPVVHDPAAALAEGAPALHPGGNLCHAFRYARGDIDAAFAACLHIIEQALETPRQIPCALEREGGVCIPTPGGLELRAATHSPFGVRKVIAEMLRLPECAVRTVGSPIGGSYGGKEEMHVQPALALLAWKARAPVRLVFTRPQSMRAATTRHPFQIRIRIGCDGEGRLRAFEADVLADGGAYASFGPEVLDTGMECIQGVYVYDAVRLAGRLVYTNNGVAGAFRGFGALQTLAASESAIDALARKAGIPPLEFRRRNLAPADAPGPLGQRIVPQPELQRVADALASLPPRPPSPPSPRFVSGLGYSLVRKGEGFGAGPLNEAGGALALNADGRVALCSSLTEMGQGMEAVIRALIARALDIGPDDAACVIGDTRVEADSGPTSASRGTQIAARLVGAAAPRFTVRALAAGSQLLGSPASELRLGPGGLYTIRDRRNTPDLRFPELFAAAGDLAERVAIPGIAVEHEGYDCHTLFTVCGARAQVLVDRWTGQIRCTAVDLVPACGEPINAAAFMSQFHGAAAQALGFCLTEDQIACNGVFQAVNLDAYFLPTIADTPDIAVHPMTWLAPNDPVGLRGAGEIGINATAPAIVNAIANALGNAPTRLPVRPEWVLDQVDKTSC